MKVPPLTVGLGGRGPRLAIVVRVEGGGRLVDGLVTAAVLVAAAILCGTDAAPTVADASVLGYGLLAVALVRLRRLAG